MPEKEIERPWAVYGFGENLIGKIVKNGEETVKIAISNTDNSPDPWDLDYVKRFSTSAEAVKYYCEIHEEILDIERSRFIRSFLNHFPNERKNIESIISQTLPKFTPKSKDSEDYIEQHCCPHD